MELALDLQLKVPLFQEDLVVEVVPRVNQLTIVVVQETRHQQLLLKEIMVEMVLKEVTQLQELMVVVEVVQLLLEQIQLNQELVQVVQEQHLVYQEPQQLTLAVVEVDNIVHRVEVAPEVLVEADQEVQVLVQLTTVMVKQEQ